MLESLQNEQLEYQKLSQEEQQRRGILGRLVGIVADFIAPTRNGRHYSEELWEKTFSDPIMKERIENGVCFGELGHPLDREETDMEKVAVCMPELPKKNKDGKLTAVFDILNTPNGRILKTLCEYGSTLGVSSRGSGDTFTGFDGKEEVDPDSYTCQGFDIVLIPAVKSARLKYVTESLNTKKSLTESLQEMIDNASEEDKKVMEETINNLQLDDSDNKIYSVRYLCTHETDDINENIYKHINVKANSEEEALKKAESYVNSTEYQNKPGNLNFYNPSLFEIDSTIYTNVDMVEGLSRAEIITKNKKHYNDLLDKISKMPEGFEKDIASELGLKWIKGNNFLGGLSDSVANKAYEKLMAKYDCTIDDIDNEFDKQFITNPIYESLSESSFGGYKYKYSINAFPNGRNIILGGSKTIEGAEKIAINQAQQVLESPWMTDKEKYDYIKTIYIVDDENEEEASTVNFDDYIDGLLSELSSRKGFKENLDGNSTPSFNIDEVSEDTSVDNNEDMFEELQKTLKQKQILEQKIIDLNEKLSVCYAKDEKSGNQINNLKQQIIKLSESSNQVTALKTKISKLEEDLNSKSNELEKLQKKFTTNINARKALTEDINSKNDSIKSLNEELTKSKELNNSLNEKIEVLNKDLQIHKSTYSKKLEKSNQLVEKYKKITTNVVNRYIDSQALKLGISSNEIKNKLPESYNIDDIDAICEDLQMYKLNISKLPFSTMQINENMQINVRNTKKEAILPKNSADDFVDEQLLSLLMEK